MIKFLMQVGLSTTDPKSAVACLKKLGRKLCDELDAVNSKQALPRRSKEQQQQQK